MNAIAAAQDKANAAAYARVFTAEQIRQAAGAVTLFTPDAVEIVEGMVAAGRTDLQELLDAHTNAIIDLEEAGEILAMAIADDGRDL